ncbi:MAG: hypothetical protein K5755_05745 [Clostridiales bacterium]|nr:hypothetical protein [Clostridiales bacterium]
MSVETSKCNKCGASFNGNFCPNCGKPREDSNSVDKKTIIIIVCIIVVLIAIAVLFYLKMTEGSRELGKEVEEFASRLATYNDSH